MTVEIRELHIDVEIADSKTQASALSDPAIKGWDEQRWLEKLKQEVLETLLERGHL